jgi:acetyltransferase
MAIVTPQAMIDTSEAARILARVAASSAKPVLGVWMGGTLVQEGTNGLQAAGIPAYATPEQAVDAFLHLAAHARHNALKVAPAGVEAESSQPSTQARAEAASLVKDRAGVVGGLESKRLLGLFGLTFADTHYAPSRSEAVAAARRIGYPVALKVVSPQVTHKTDVGGVRLDLRNDDEAASAFDEIRRNLEQRDPHARFDGVTVERMLDRSAGVEFILGVKRDATFGPVVLVGAGGTTAEVLGDRALGLAPMCEARARGLLEHLRIAPVLGPFRGRPALNTRALASAIAAMSRLIAQMPTILEADANPVLVTPTDATVLDARVVLGPTRGGAK